MNREWQHIPISQYNTFDHLSTEEIKKLSEQYPYSSFYQLLLSFKLKEDNEPAYKKQSSKTALYINNLPWLSYVLNNASSSVTLPEAENINTADLLSDEVVDDVVTETEREQEVGHEPEMVTDNYTVNNIVVDDEKVAEPEIEHTQGLERNYSLISNTPDINNDEATEQEGEHDEQEVEKDHSLVSSILDREKEIA
ncbi:MAG: hypothetical protein HYR66_19025, partial [Sphingobacteriales bacterium]|nr:hypothetical protein [Sphingobacteriales bacterium]